MGLGLWAMLLEFERCVTGSGLTALLKPASVSIKRKSIGTDAHTGAVVLHFIRIHPQVDLYENFIYFTISKVIE